MIGREGDLGEPSLLGRIATDIRRWIEIQRQPYLDTTGLAPCELFTPEELNEILERAQNRINAHPVLADRSNTCIHIAQFAFGSLMRDKGIDPTNISVYAIAEALNGSVKHAYLIIQEGPDRRSIFNHPVWEGEFGPEHYGEARLGTDDLQMRVKDSSY